MKMESDFFDAHERHWQSAELLYANKHWANADHLYGLSAECGVKALIVVFCGFKQLPKKDYKHLNEIEATYEAYRSDRNVTEYSISFLPFNDWNIEQRYANRHDFVQKNVAAHKKATHTVRETLKQAKLAGHLS